MALRSSECARAGVVVAATRRERRTAIGSSRVVARLCSAHDRMETADRRSGGEGVDQTKRLL